MFLQIFKMCIIRKTYSKTCSIIYHEHCLNKVDLKKSEKDFSFHVCAFFCALGTMCMSVSIIDARALSFVYVRSVKLYCTIVRALIIVTRFCSMRYFLFGVNIFSVASCMSYLAFYFERCGSELSTIQR